MKPDVSRREFVKQGLKATAGAVVAGHIAQGGQALPLSAQNTFQFSQGALPYSYAALEPAIDALTMEIHYTRHHAAYIKNVNEAIVAEKISAANEADFFSGISKLSAKARNHGGGAWNHNFFWLVMAKPGSVNQPGGKLADAIQGTFGSFDKFKEQFSQAAMARFGSGWAWLVNDRGTLKIGSTPNQDNPLMDVSDVKGTPLLALDVWEHAYYLKYQNRRNEYVANWWSVVNWHEVAKRLV